METSEPITIDSITPELLQIIFRMVPLAYKPFIIMTCKKWYWILVTITTVTTTKTVNTFFVTMESTTTTTTIIKVSTENYVNIKKQILLLIKEGDLHCLKYGTESPKKLVQHYTYYIACIKEAAYGGFIDILKWLDDGTGNIFIKTLCTSAAHGNQLEVLKWARENNCPWDNQVCLHAVKNNNFELLKWAIENDCVCNYSVCKHIIKYDRVEIFEWIMDNYVFGTSLKWEYDDMRKYGSLKIVKWLKERNFP